MNPSTPKTASMVSLADDLEELDLHFEEIFDQFRNAYCLFDDINRLLTNCPLEFLLFEIQQLVSFLHRHWKCPPLALIINNLLPPSPSRIPQNLSPLLFEKTDKSHTFVTSCEDNMLLSLVFITTSPTALRFSRWNKLFKSYETIATMFLPTSPPPMLYINFNLS